MGCSAHMTGAAGQTSGGGQGHRQSDQHSPAATSIHLTQVGPRRRSIVNNLAPGESQTVELCVAYDELALFGRDMKRVVEPGDFELFVGSLKGRLSVLP